MMSDSDLVRTGDREEVASPQKATRREFIRSAATAGIVAGSLTTAQTAAAEHMDEPGENVKIEFDQAMLEAYRPRLVFPAEAKEKFLGLYGWVVRSEDEDTDVCCYWCRYSHQDGWIANIDSHDLDHEPIHVEVDSETGDVRRVRASIYHWIKGEVIPTEDLLYQETHPFLRVLSPHHQYTAAGLADGGVFQEVKDLTDAYPSWLKNGLEEDIYPGATTVPWRMQTRPHWWKDAFAGFSPMATLFDTLRSIGYDETGTLEVSE